MDRIMVPVPDQELRTRVRLMLKGASEAPSDEMMWGMLRTVAEIAGIMGAPPVSEIKAAFASVIAESQPMAPEEAEYQRAFGPKPPVSDPSETLALIAEHRLRLEPDGSLWLAFGLLQREHYAETMSGAGATIGDAVRECVKRIREGNRG